MNNKNNSNNFDYDEYLKRLKKLNDDAAEFSISAAKEVPKQAPKSNKSQSDIEFIPIKTSKAIAPTSPVSQEDRVPKQVRQREKLANSTQPIIKKPTAKKPVKKKKSKNNKKGSADLIKRILMIVIAILFCVILAVFFTHLNSDADLDSDLTESETVSETETEVETTEVTTTQPVAVTYSYETLLVNFENPLPDDYSVTLVDYQDANGNWWTVAEEIVDPLDTIIAAAANAGVYLAINSAYRSNEAQNKLFVTSVEDYEAEGYSYDEAYDLTGDYVAEPGTSEHETGLSIDFGYTGSTTWTQCYSWLESNSYLYGFIVRYPSGKSEITNITYETWHYRYVGVEIATEMYELDMCLEEYYEYKGW